MSAEKYLERCGHPVPIPERGERFYSRDQVLELLQPFFDEYRVQAFVTLCKGYPDENPFTLWEETLFED